jgi:hypothetical protein
MTLKERTDDMVARHGETVKFVTAGRIIDRDVRSVKRMLEDGRLDSACGGTMVDVLSIARYICAPAIENTKARLRKQGRDTRWAV